jgi:hypothetical protein
MLRVIIFLINVRPIERFWEVLIAMLYLFLLLKNKLFFCPFRVSEYRFLIVFRVYLSLRRVSECEHDEVREEIMCGTQAFGVCFDGFKSIRVSHFFYLQMWLRNHVIRHFTLNSFHLNMLIKRLTMSC